jgi:phosphoglycolate phosphatase
LESIATNILILSESSDFNNMDLLIFDLDGTLIDSKLDLAHAVNATRRMMGLSPIDNEVVYSYVGNGAPVLIRRAIGEAASEEQLQTALEFFLTYYRAHMLDYTTLYQGVRETLDTLHSRGVKMAVLTNKPVRFSQAILDGLGVSAHFAHVYGGNSFDQKKPHPMGVETLLVETATERNKAMMVGDSAVDVRTARNAKIASCGVTYGFQPETLITDPPDYLIDRMEELLDLLQQPFPTTDRSYHIDSL